MNAIAAMQRAIEISSFGLGKTKGNPIVGAVIFNETGIIKNYCANNWIAFGFTKTELR